MVAVHKFTISPVIRAVLIVGAIAGLVAGVTYAALSSSATLTGNTISASAGLQVGTTVEGATTYGSSREGFDFVDITQGGTGVSQTFNLRNATTSSTMALTLRVPTAPTFTGGSVDLAKTKVALACTTPTLTMPATAVSALVAGEITITGTLAPAEDADCTVTVTMDEDAIDFDDGSTSVDSTAFDLRFTGTSS